MLSQLMLRFFMTRKGRRFLNVAVMLFGLWAFRKRALRKCLESGVSSPRRRSLLQLCHEKRDAWETYLERLNLGSDSPLRKHLRQLLSRMDIDGELRRLYDMLVKDVNRKNALRDLVHEFNLRMEGQVHVLLQVGNRIGLVPPTPRNKKGSFLEHLEEVFPPQRPLDRDSFPSFAKLLLVRRIFKTLETCFSLEQLCSEGCCPLPTVITISVDLGEDVTPFRIHTVTPLSGSLSAETLCLIEEDDDDSPTSTDSSEWSTEAGSASSFSVSSMQTSNGKEEFMSSNSLKHTPGSASSALVLGL